MVRLLANENFPRPALRLLREWGIDVSAITELAPGSDDAKVLARARAEGRWLLTFDRDYGDLVFAKRLPAPPAIIFLRQEPYPPTRPATLVKELLLRPQDCEGYFVVLFRGTTRRRKLP